MPFGYQSARTKEAHWLNAVNSLSQRPGILVDIGGGRPFQGHISPEKLGPDTTYLCLDIALKAQPHVVGDALQLPLATGTVDSVFCNAVLEHVPDPSKAVNEINRVLRQPGSVMVAVPFIYPYHDQVDYYRFTDSALEYIFREFDNVEIQPVGDYFFATLMFLTGFHYKFAHQLDRLLGGLRSGFRLGLATYEYVMGQSRTRNYRRSLERSPVGWHVFAEKQ